MNREDVIIDKMNKLSEMAHDNIDFETLIDYGLSEEDKEEYYELSDEIENAISNLEVAINGLTDFLNDYDKATSEYDELNYYIDLVVSVKNSLIKGELG